MMRLLSTILVALATSSSAWAQQAQSTEDLNAIGRAATILRQQGSASPLLRDLANQAEAIAGEQQLQSRPLRWPCRRRGS